PEDSPAPEPTVPAEPPEDAPAPPPSKPAAHRAKRRVIAPAEQRPGFFSVDSDPYATIYVDGKRLDQTPLFKVELPAGTHRIRAVRADGRERTYRIKLAPGEHVNSGTLKW